MTRSGVDSLELKRGNGVSLEPGGRLSHYRIEQKLGEGGMGIVFLAEDTRLGRKVALKVLPSELSSDAMRRARFEREARAIAALNHPNIVTIHSVEEVDGVCFLTMELVDGQRLTHLLTGNGLPLGKLLDLSIGIADALVAAHREGVVHRDLKPDNIMVTGDGRVKVLDFGLAKLREAVPERPDGTALPTASITEEGKILGTAAYMSPEQAEGKPLDHRSDIFSFGIVLYEMATGRKPFQGETSISTISSILKDTPTPPQQINTAVPVALGRIVRRCLAKETERRYQSTGDLRNELRDLKEESESGELTLERPAAASTTRERPAATPLPRLRLLLGLAVLVAAIAAGAVWLLTRAPSPAGSTGASLPPMQMSRATTDGSVAQAAISPDGRYLAYVRREKGAYSLRLRQVATGDEVQVVSASPTELASPSFSSDGDFLLYVSIEPGKPLGSAQRVSVLGGAPRRIFDGVSNATTAPDGRRLALVVGAIDHSVVKIAGADGEDPRDLVMRKGRDHFDSHAAWSSDGRRLAIVSHRFGEPQQIVLIDPETGQESVLPVPSLRSVVNLTWVPGESALFVAGSTRPANQGAAHQLWKVSTSGDLEPITRDLNSYSEVTVTGDGATVAAVQEELRTGIDVAPVRDGVPGAFTELFPVSAARSGHSGMAWVDGTRLAHSMLQGDTLQVFLTDISSRSSRVLTTGPAAHHHPVVSRDGRVMVVGRDDGPHINLWRVDLESGREQPLTDGQFDGNHALSSDGAWVVYSSALDTITLFKIPGGGGKPIPLLSRPSWCTDVSVDDRDALCYVTDPSGTTPSDMLVPLGGGEPRAVTGIPADAFISRFGPDGRSITYVVSRDGSGEIWSLPPSGGKPRLLVRFDGQDIRDFRWSPDGARLAVVKVKRSGDVVLLRRPAP